MESHLLESLSTCMFITHDMRNELHFGLLERVKTRNLTVPSMGSFKK